MCALSPGLQGEGYENGQSAVAHRLQLSYGLTINDGANRGRMTGAKGPGVVMQLKHRPRALVAVLTLLALLTWGVSGAVAWFSWELTSGLPDREGLRRLGDMAQATTLYDIHGRPAFTIYKEQRIEVPLTRVSRHLVRAILATEDQRFYDHRGVDTVRVLGAIVANLRQGRRAQGGSTITQQLARQSFLTLDKTMRRKVKEAILAAQIERTYSKDEILELYLNKVYFGDGLYGVEAASLGYFGKHASDLTVAEAALLAGLVKSPSTYAPTVSLERATARRAVVLQAMQQEGAITSAVAKSAREAPVVLEDRLRRQEPYGLYFKEQVRQSLVQQFGWARVYQGGLQVHTTIDLDMQRAAEDAVRQSIGEIETQRSKSARKQEEDPSNPLQGALVAIEVATGEVRAMVGGRNFEQSRFNRAVQARRQPGSAFKPFVFAAAIESGYTPASLIDRLDEPVMTLQGEWTPEDEHTSATSMTLRSALRVSSNRAAVRLLENVGIDRTVSYAKALGVGSQPSVPSLALGSGEVTPLALTAAFSTFANRGLSIEPALIRRVQAGDGTLLYEHRPAPHRVITESTAFLLTSMLADVVNFGTAWKARRLGFTLPAAGKTGTTNDYVDAWFVGFTPKLVAGVWLGFDQPRTIISNGYAADLAVPLWARFMKAATKGDKPEWYVPPRGIIGVNVCRMSGRLPAEGCKAVDVLRDDGTVETRSMVYTEYFVRGTQPTDVCPLHPGTSFFDRIAGLFGRETEPVPADAAAVPTTAGEAPPVAAAEPASQTASSPEQAPPKKKKRGFWAKVFGVGKDANRNGDEPRDRK